MTTHDLEYETQQIALADTIAWDEVYACACRNASETGHAQLILERGPANYELVNGQSSDALKVERLHGAKIHVILNWEGYPNQPSGKHCRDGAGVAFRAGLVGCARTGATPFRPCGLDP